MASGSSEPAISRSSRIVCPRRTWSPMFSGISCSTSRSFMRVPLNEPRSSIVTCPSPTETIAWRRDTSSSVRWTVAVGSRPMTDCAVSGNDRPWSGPSTTTSSISELLVDPVHRGAELLAHGFDLVVLAFLAHTLEILLTGLVLRNPLLGELTGLDLREDLLHGRARRLADHALAAGQVAVLGGVRDRVAHPGDALLVHQVHDQLELVQALEVREPGVVAGVNQGLVAGTDQLGQAAAEHGLLAEQVGLGLLLEAGLDHAGARAADALGVGEHEVLGVAGGVLVDGHQARAPVALLELAAHQVPGALRGDHAHVHLGARLDLPEVDGEAVGEHQEVARGDAVLDLGVPDLGLLLVGE